MHVIGDIFYECTLHHDICGHLWSLCAELAGVTSTEGFLVHYIISQQSLINRHTSVCAINRNTFTV